MLFISVESLAHGGIGVAGDMSDLLFGSLFIWLGAVLYIGISMYMITKIKWLLILSPIIPFVPVASLYLIAFLVAQIISFNSPRQEEQILFLASVVIHLLLAITWYITSRNRQTKQVILVVVTPLILVSYVYYQLFAL